MKMMLDIYAGPEISMFKDVLIFVGCSVAVAVGLIILVLKLKKKSADKITGSDIQKEDDAEQ